MEEELSTLDDKKLQVLLHANECLNNRVLLSVRLYYDVGIIIASSVVLIGAYSIINTNYKLFLAIPILIALGETFYLHLVHLVMRFEWHMINNIEFRFDETIEPKILNISRKVGVFRNLDNQKEHASLKFHMRKWLPYLGGYIFFSIIALTFNIGKITKIENLHITIKVFELSVCIYLLILVGLIIAIRRIYNEYNTYSKKIKLLILKQSEK